MRNKHTVYVIWVEGVWGREMLKVKAVVAMRMAAAVVGRRDVWEAVRATARWIANLGRVRVSEIRLA